MAYEFKFPDVGEGVHEGKVIQLTKSPGDAVEEGDIIAIVETDKVVAEIPTSKSGKLVKYGTEEGQIIEVGNTLAFIDDGSQASAPDEGKKDEKSEDNAGVVGELEGAGDFVLPASGEGITDRSSESVSLTGINKRVLATPLARKIASDQGIDINQIKGTGPAGRVTKENVLGFISAKKGQASGSLHSQVAANVPAPAKAPLDAPLVKKPAVMEDTVETLPHIRKTIAANMQKSSEIPTASFHEQCAIDETARFRKQVNGSIEGKISYLPIYIKAISIALKKYPVFNATFNPEKMELRKFKNINIGIAVETDRGLMVPVVKNIELKTIQEIDFEMKELIAKARNGSIGIEDMRDGTFTITNYGSFGGLYGNPLILPPQVGILGIGRIHQAPVVKGGEVVPATIQPVSLVFDHRVVDGAPASSFISYFKSLLEDPYKLLMEMN